MTMVSVGSTTIGLGLAVGGVRGMGFFFATAPPAKRSFVRGKQVIRFLDS